MKERPDFRSPEFLREQALKTMAFYDGRCIDPAGGFFHAYTDDGSIYDRRTRHLVSSARFVVTHAWATRRFPTHARAPAWRDAVEHGLRFLREAHLDPATGGYAWVLEVDEHGGTAVVDATRHSYGLGCVLLAHAQALMAGIDCAADGVASTFALMERHFWEPAHGLYAGEASPEWRLLPARGQNANLQAVEALLAAHEASGGETPYLARAQTIAESLVQRLAAGQDGLVWERYSPDWSPDWEPSAEAAGDTLRPWGYQVGTLARWARALLALERLLPGLGDDNWLQHRARQLFAAAVNHGWDRAHGSLARSFAPDGRVIDADKHAWVQAEALGAAAALAERTGEGGYWDWYDRIWACAWDHFVDHTHGAWYRQLGPDHHKLDNRKSPPGKVDYHTMGACYEAIDALEREPVLR